MEVLSGSVNIFRSHRHFSKQKVAQARLFPNANSVVMSIPRCVMSPDREVKIVKVPLVFVASGGGVVLLASCSMPSTRQGVIRTIDSSTNVNICWALEQTMSDSRSRDRR